MQGCDTTEYLRIPPQSCVCAVKSLDLAELCNGELLYATPGDAHLEACVSLFPADIPEPYPLCTELSTSYVQYGVPPFFDVFFSLSKNMRDITTTAVESREISSRAFRNCCVLHWCNWFYASDVVSYFTRYVYSLFDCFVLRISGVIFFFFVVRNRCFKNHPQGGGGDVLRPRQKKYRRERKDTHLRRNDVRLFRSLNRKCTCNA